MASTSVVGIARRGWVHTPCLRSKSVVDTKLNATRVAMTSVLGAGFSWCRGRHQLYGLSFGLYAWRVIISSKLLLMHCFGGHAWAEVLYLGMAVLRYCLAQAEKVGKPGYETRYDCYSDEHVSLAWGKHLLLPVVWSCTPP